MSTSCENSDGLNLLRRIKRNRDADPRAAHRHLKRVRYGNRRPLLIDADPSKRPSTHVPAPDFSGADWMFEVVFDYGEGHYQEMAADADDRIFATATLKPPIGGQVACAPRSVLQLPQRVRGPHLPPASGC